MLRMCFLSPDVVLAGVACLQPVNSGDGGDLLYRVRTEMEGQNSLSNTRHDGWVLEPSSPIGTTTDAEPSDAIVDHAESESAGSIPSKAAGSGEYDTGLSIQFPQS